MTGVTGGTGAALAELDRRLGDPWDPGNPVGFAAVLAADERGELPPAGEAALDGFGLNAEYVPAALGGRLSQVDRLVQVLRTVHRRDPCLGLGHGASTLMAAVNVWTAGSARQQAEVADLLLRNGKLACAYHELAHGGDLGRAELTALPRGRQLRVSGRKEVVANIARAEAMVLFARTEPAGHGRAHSQLLVRRADLPPGAVRDLRRFRTSGLRGVPLGGIEFSDCRVDAEAVLGARGRGLETALRSFQLTRVVVPGMVLGILDTALRLAVRWSGTRRLYGGTAADLDRTRAVLADAYADLLACDAFCRVAARAVHLLPAQTVLYASALKYLVPKLVIAAVTRLSDLLGASFYLRGGEFGLLQKLVRDVRPAGFGHAGAASCLLSLVPQLPGLARRGWCRPGPVPDPLFDDGTPLPDLDLTRLGLYPGGRDPLAAALPELAARLAGHPHPAVPALAARAADGLAGLAAECRALPPHELGAGAGAGTYDLAARYARLLAAAAGLGTAAAAAGLGTAAAAAADTTWVAGALCRLGGDAVPRDVREWLLTDLLDRVERGQPLDLTRRRTHGGRVLSGQR